MALSAGTYINAFAVTIAESQEVTRIALPRPDFPRRDLERSHRARLFIYEGAGWTAAPVNGQPRLIHLFNIREALRAQAERVG